MVRSGPHTLSLLKKVLVSILASNAVKFSQLCRKHVLSEVVNANITKYR